MTHPGDSPHGEAPPRRAPRVVASLSVAMLLGLAALMTIGLTGAHHASVDHAPPLWPVGIAPFAALLLAIAILPLVPACAHWWHSNLNRLFVALAHGATTCVFMLLTQGLDPAATAVKHALVDEYGPFIVLLLSLYVITGGIAIHGNMPATPATNGAILLIGTLLASVLGTTGASMLLIRPLLQTNRERRHKVHTVVFFIFLVSNVGGSLLPVGDPPLFLGYLQGVPFLWTLGLWGEWLLASSVLLAVYLVWDTIMYRRESLADIRRDNERVLPERIDGSINFLWLLGVLLAVALVSPDKPFLGTGWRPFPYLRELLMLGFTALSLATTPREARTRNEFNYHAIAEVAALFIGIFVAMQVPLQVLAFHGASLGIEHPATYFWMTGILSSFLDNAPTYQVFLETAVVSTTRGAAGNIHLLAGREVDPGMLQAISVGAVFMGANTYIGNGPNFMVKSIADAADVKMPSFFGYMAYSGAVLVPLFVLITLIFFR
ncbi:MAG: sodium:proton antiporter [Phycisphaerales bacterium]